MATGTFPISSPAALVGRRPRPTTALGIAGRRVRDPKPRPEKASEATPLGRLFGSPCWGGSASSWWWCFWRFRVLPSAPLAHQPQEEDHRGGGKSEASPVKDDVEVEAGQTRGVYRPAGAGADRGAAGFAARVVDVGLNGSVTGRSSAGLDSAPTGAVPPLIPTDHT